MTCFRPAHGPNLQSMRATLEPSPAPDDWLTVGSCGLAEPSRQQMRCRVALPRTTLRSPSGTDVAERRAVPLPRSKRAGRQLRALPHHSRDREWRRARLARARRGPYMAARDRAHERNAKRTASSIATTNPRTCPSRAHVIESEHALRDSYVTAGIRRRTAWCPTSSRS